MNELTPHGLIIPEIKTRKEGAEHVLGGFGLTEPIILPSGDWTPYLPDKEPQSKNGVETNACTVFGTLTALEELVFFKTGVKVNYSDRYVANVAKRSGILNPSVGADPHKMAELIRTITGLIAEGKCAWTDDIKTSAEYYSVGDEIFQLLKEGPNIWKDWTFTHKWVFTGGTPQEKREKLIDARKRGAVCVSVRAWKQRNGLYYKEVGEGDNHWTNSPNDVKVFDSYDNYLKDLEPLYDFGLAKVYFLTPAPFLKNMYFQMMDDEVRRLQSALIQLGYPIPHAVTNIYGTETRGAVHAFQRDNGIEGNFGNNVGPKTRLALNTKLNPDAAFGGSFVTFIGSFFSSV